MNSSHFESSFFPLLDKTSSSPPQRQYLEETDEWVDETLNLEPSLTCGLDIGPGFQSRASNARINQWASTTTDESVPMRPTKRKRQRDNRLGEKKKNVKRPKVMGRPRNNWTRSRLRKLVRLYLLTDLSVEEIAKVLRGKDFMPCKRDVQKQIRDHLQRDPRQIREQGTMPKTRLQLVRECRALKSVKGSATTENLSVTVWGPFRNPNQLSGVGESMQAFELLETLLPTEQPSVSSTAFSENNSGPQSPRSTGSLEAMTKAISDGKWTQSTIDIAEEAPLSTSKVPTLASSQTSVHSTRSLDTPHDAFITLADNLLEDRFPFMGGPLKGTGIRESDTQQDATPESGDSPKWSLPPMSEQKQAARPASLQSSIQNIQGLKSRLPYKTDSCLGDVYSVLQNLTISGSSTRSFASRQSKMVAKFSASIFGISHVDGTLRGIDENGESTSLPRVVEPRLPLPGDYAAYNTYKTYFIGQRRYRRKLDELERGPAIMKDSRSSKLAAKMVANINQDIDVKVPRYSQWKDAFGNTELHITAALGKDPSWLIGMIDRDANVHAENSAGETFLHLLDDCEIDTVNCSFLCKLRDAGYDFHQRNCLGQTALHQLMQEWMGKSRLEAILEALRFLDIPLPLSRDCFGITILSELRRAGIHESTIQNALSEIGYRSPSEGPWHATYMAGIKPMAEFLATNSPQSHENSIDTKTKDPSMYPYDHHKSLLEIIVKAYSNPLSEDHEGRNGLHCLAEVSLTLPILCMPIHGPTSKRGPYLFGLIHAGVDPDNHDNQGMTPLMAFINHTRVDEDDETTENLLSQLCNAGASVHHRNRMGETPLHIAVRLGRKCATKFLLDKGANIHARDILGNSIIALGLEHSRKANNTPLYAQIMLCIDLVTKAGSVSAPTFYQEWALVDDTNKGSKSRRRISLPRLPLRTLSPPLHR